MMRHERWPRLKALWLREAGREDPLWPPEGLWSCGHRLGDWGVTRAHREGVERLTEAYSGRRRVMLDRHQAELKEFDRSYKRHLDRYQSRAGGDQERNRHVELHEDRTITFYDGGDSVELARFLGSRQHLLDERRTKKRGEHAATVLVNGDGFDDRQLQLLQAELRREAGRVFGQLQVMVVPYTALNAAGIQIETIKRIVVTADGGENVTVNVQGPAPADLKSAQAAAVQRIPDYNKEHNHWQTHWFPFNSRGSRYQLQVNATRNRPGAQHTINRQVQMWRQPLDGLPGWHLLRHDEKTGWHVTEWRHRLGASVFTAIDASGERHRFISAFDLQETPPLYFLAQLPDYGKAIDFTQALDLLAPPIVHHARNVGKAVYRQGDVFFVETELSKEILLERGGVFYAGSGRGRYANRPVNGRNIYRTGHYATEVIVLPNGVTFAYGIVVHLPDGREPEHRSLPLEESSHDGWFLCLRNTVPRSALAQDSAGTLRLDDPSLQPERTV